MRTRVHWFVALALLAVPLTGSGCEPIVPMVQLLSGCSLVGPLLVTRSLFWLAVAVAIKTAAFLWFERRLPWGKAVGSMVLANVVSTIPGVLLAAFAGSISGVFLAVPLVYGLGKWVERRLALFQGQVEPKWISGGTAAFAFTGVFLLSLVMFVLAGDALEGGHFAGYWLLKFLFVAAVAATGILISAVLEESVIARLSRRSHGSVSFFTPVFRANYIALALVLLVAALQMVPKRLNAPHFIVAWLQLF
jgi:hypothetical protein